MISGRESIGGSTVVNLNSFLEQPHSYIRRGSVAMATEIVGASWEMNAARVL